MRPTRRAALGLLAGALAGPRVAQARPRDLDRPVAVPVEASVIGAFSPDDPQRTRFGDLIFRGGLQLKSAHSSFGGYSGLWRGADGSRLVALSDTGSWLTGTPVYEGGTLAGLADTVLAPVLGTNGQPLAAGRSYDTEGFTVSGGTAFISIERTQEVMRFDTFGRDGILSRGRTVPVPIQVKLLPSNQGLEAIGIAPRGSPVAGALVAIAERSGGVDGPTRGFILTGPRRGIFHVDRPGRYDITDMAFLPGGDLVLLERRFSFATSLNMRLRLIPAARVRPGGWLKGEVLMQANLNQAIDNMEGLSVHRGPDGRLVLTLISDDNFAVYQRTILLEFAFAEGRGDGREDGRG